MIHRLVRKWCSRCYGNLRWFILSYPPMVLFTLSISLFAILLTLLAVYVSKTTTLNRMDVSEDWNTFLQSFSNVEFCVIHDNSSVHVESKRLATMKKRPLASAKVRTVSVLMSLTIHPTKDFVSVPHSIMYLSASMNAKSIGLKGEKHRLNVTTIVPYRLNSSSCSNIPLHGCEVIELEACIELSGSPDVFPLSSRKPKTCPMPSLSGVDYWAKMNWQLIDLDSVYYCRSRTMIGMKHTTDLSLFEPLKKPHRSVIRLHLLHTSFFLYVFIAAVVTYAMIFNHSKHRLIQPESPIYDF